MDYYRVIIAGSRTFNDYDLLNIKVNHLLKDKLKTHKVLIISGGARGADKLGERWALDNDLELKVYPALWNKFYKKAGFIRNQEMADNADALIAFSVNHSSGTRDMIYRARRAGLDVSVVRL